MFKQNICYFRRNLKSISEASIQRNAESREGHEVISAAFGLWRTAAVILVMVWRTLNDQNTTKQPTTASNNLQASPASGRVRGQKEAELCCRAKGTRLHSV
ncbi:hypothetical protein FQA47_016048 [Oryzias melastigma]|uniref:Uncharacterized protein n=1 Tax=Oryzias melastigma TaxID=30732 RepID=A0A834FNT9_ORYME|nr:hypothetical protein FQA47_016048 [Oryzias melastigma]